MKKVGVVIVNYKLKKEVERAIESVFKSSYNQIEIVLVDNDSGDGVEDLADKFPKIHFIQNKSNLGFCGGNNIGISLALKLGCEYILLLNPDAWVDKSTIECLVKDADKLGASILGPKVYFPDKKTILYAGGIFDYLNVLGSHRGVDEIDTGQYDDLTETDYVSGGAMFINKSLLDKIGLLDEDYFLYYEDADFCYRAKRAGFKIYYDPKAVAYHESGKVTGIGSPLQDYYITRNRMIFAKKFLPIRTQFALIGEGFRNIANRSRRKALVDFLLGRYKKQSII